MSNLRLLNATINDVKMVVFDKDGTLIDVHHYWCSMIKFRAQFLVESIKDENFDKAALYNDLLDSMGIDLNTKKMKPKGPVGIKPRSFIEDVVLSTMSKYTNDYTLEKIKEIFKQVDEFSITKLNDIVQPLAGVEKTLKKLYENDILLSIATTDLTSRAVLAMKTLCLDNYFVDITGVDLVNNAKPHPELLEYLAKKYNLLSDNIVLIGDSMADLNMAKNYGCKFIGVKTGLFNDEFLVESEYLIENLDQLEVER